MSIPARSLRASCAALLLGDVADADRTARRFVRLSALSGLALLAATRRLWLQHETVPQIPFVPVAANVPQFVDVVLLGMLAAAWIVQAVVPGGRIGRGAALAACVALGGLVLLDQLRMQPWVWQLFVLNALFACESPRGIVAGARLVAVAIPFWSALSKLDVVFPVEHGALLLDGLGRATGLPVTTWSPGIRRALAFAMPAGELLAALALIVPRTRRLGLVLVLGMHATLCAILGPWGLDHEAGVLVWNVACALQAWVLFGPGVRRSDPNRATTASWCPGSTSASPPERVGVARVGTLAARGTLALAVVVGPLLEPWDLWDHWPAWSLYAARPERVLLWVGADQAVDLPESLRPFVDRPDWDDRCRVRFDRWVLHELGVPVPPQGRVQTALAATLARGAGPDGARVVLEGPAGRFDGRRTRETFDGADALEAALGRYVLGTQPRVPPAAAGDAGVLSSP